MTDDIDKLLRRMDTVERNVSDHASSLGKIVDEIGKVDARVRVLEGIQQDRRVSDVERTSRETSMQKDISTIQSDVMSIKTGINRVLWAVASAVIVVFVGFVLRGGLNG